MLDLAIIHRPGMITGKQNLGRILEAMLYYDRVHLVMSAQMFVGIWHLLGPDDFHALLSHPTVTTTLTPEMLSVTNTSGTVFVTHRPVAIKMAGRRERLIPDNDDVGTLHHMLCGLPDGPNGTRAQVNRLVKLAKRSRYSKILGGRPESQERFLSLVRDESTLKLFLRGWAAANGQILNELALQNAKFSAVELGEEFTILSTISPEQIVSGWDHQNSWGHILNNIQDFAVDLYLSNAYSADIITEPEISEVASARLDLSLQRSTRNIDQITAFEEMVFEEAHAFAAAFNNNAMSLKDALVVIDKSRKFRTWTKGLPPDAHLITEYHRAVSKETKLGSLPASIARFAFFGAAGIGLDAFVPGSGLTASAIDTFVVERMLGGWRPNIFVRNVQKALSRAQSRARK